MLGAERNGICRRLSEPRYRWIWDSDCLASGLDNRRSCRDSCCDQQTYLFSRASRPDLAPTLPIGRSFLTGKAAKA